MAAAHEQKLRLIDVLRREKDRKGSYDRLAQDIASVAGVTVDRRKLKNLVEGLDVSLRISEMKALDAYLGPLGEGLAAKPMFEQSAVLADIAQGTESVFLLGSLPRDDAMRIDISHWDVRSMMEVLRSLNHYGRTQIDIEEVVYRPSEGHAARSVKKDVWFARLTSDRASLVCVGSPRANRASEAVLARMFEVSPFVAPSDASSK